MPILDGYIAEVTVSVVLHSDNTGGQVASYSVTRQYKGGSASGASGVVQTATDAALAASKSFAAGLDNAEARRLK